MFFVHLDKFQSCKEFFLNFVICNVPRATNTKVDLVWIEFGRIPGRETKIVGKLVWRHLLDRKSLLSITNKEINDEIKPVLRELAGKVQVSKNTKWVNPNSSHQVCVCECFDPFPSSPYIASMHLSLP